MTESEIVAMSRSFGDAVRMARDAGMDCVEIHAGQDPALLLRVQAEQQKFSSQSLLFAAS